MMIKRTFVALFLGILSAVGVLSLIPAADAVTGSRPIMTVPLDSGFARVVNGVELPNAAPITSADLAPDAGFVVVGNPALVAAGYVPTLQGDGGTYWQGPLTTVPYGDEACAVVDAGLVFCTNIKMQGSAWTSSAPSDAGVVYFQNGQYQTCGAPTARGQVFTATDAGPAWANATFTAGGDLNASEQVVSLTGADGGITVANNTNVRFTVAGVTPNVVPGAAITVPYSVSATYPIIASTYGASGQADVLDFNGTSSTLWVGGATGGGINNVLVHGSVSAGLEVNGVTYLLATSSQIQASKPIVGDGIGSPWGVNGSTGSSSFITLTASRSATNAEVAMSFILITGSYNYTMPTPADYAHEYGKWFQIGPNSPVILTSGGGNFTPTANKNYFLWFEVGGIHVLSGPT